jgi:hypothetical protein
MAAAILYGLMVGIRTTRGLEQACENRVDFLWLVEGRRIDHSTFANFRKDFGRQVKALFKQIGRLALKMGLVRLGTVALDGTRMRANASRYTTASAKTLQERLARLDAEVERLMAESDAAEEAERNLFGDHETPNRLPRPLANLKKRQEALRRALTAARAAAGVREHDAAGACGRGGGVSDLWGRGLRGVSAVGGVPLEAGEAPLGGAGPARGAARGDAGAADVTGGAGGVPASGAVGGRDDRADQGGAGGAAVPASGPGAREDGMAVGMHSGESDETDRFAAHGHGRGRHVRPMEPLCLSPKGRSRREKERRQEVNAPGT